jgi:hypothetical protein
MARRVVPIRLDTGSDSPMTIRYRSEMDETFLQFTLQTLPVHDLSAIAKKVLDRPYFRSHPPSLCPSIRH